MLCQNFQCFLFQGLNVYRDMSTFFIKPPKESISILFELIFIILITELLSELFGISEEHNLGVGVLIKIKFAIISAIFDYNPKISAAMKPEYWEKCMPSVEHLLEMIGQNQEQLTTGEHIAEDSEVLDKSPYRVRGCFLAVVERLNEEFYKVIALTS